MATGGIQNLNEQKIKLLKGRSIILFPNLHAYDTWKQVAEKFRSIENIRLSDFLERRATKEEKQAGFDLADYLLRFQ